MEELVRVIADFPFQNISKELRDAFVDIIAKLESAGITPKDAFDFMEEQYSVIEEARDAVVSAVFVVTQTGDAPVCEREIVTAEMHTELVQVYAASGYAAESANISRRNLNRIAVAAGK